MLQNLITVLILSALIVGTNAKPQIGGRIIGGYEARLGQFPYQVALNITMKETGQNNFCGGSLISNDYVLTAAHCVVIAKEIDVILGGLQINITESSQVRLSSKDFIVPEAYVSGTNDVDLALIKLPQSVEFNEYIQPITLAEGNDTYAGEVATVAGWGVRWGAQTTIEPVLRWAENVILSNHQCVKDDPLYKILVKNGHICQSTLGGKGSCHGDSGGALALDGVQIGIVSFGYDNCFYFKPVVYTRITSFRDWIRENTGV